MSRSGQAAEGYILLAALGVAGVYYGGRALVHGVKHVAHAIHQPAKTGAKK